MRWKVVRAIANKDLLEVRQNQAAWVPMLVVPIVFIVFLPLLFFLLPSLVNSSMGSNISLGNLQPMLKSMPPVMRAGLEGLNENQLMIKMFLGYYFGPFFLIMPLMFSTIIASESFAGERERKTLEALLYTPASDAELFVGKALAGVIPAIIISWGSFILYTLVLNIGGYSLFGGLWFPLPSWYPLIFWVAPAMSLLGVAFTVLISSRVQTFMGAYQLSGSTVILVLALLLGQIAGVLYLDVTVGLLLGLLIWILDFVLVKIAVSRFNRTALLISHA
jgi:ABC-2 type transport system permease protein